MEGLYHIITILGTIALTYGLWWVTGKLTDLSELQGDKDGKNLDTTTEPK